MNTNRKLTTLFIALLLLAATAATADVRSSTSQPIREVPDHGPGPDYRPVDVEIWTQRGDDARYCAGDSIEVFFRTNVDAWVAIYDVDTRGRVTKLFPSRNARHNFVRGGVVNRVPSSYGHHFEVEGPSGWETLRAVASTHRRALRDFDRHDARRYDDRRYDDPSYDDPSYDDRRYDDRRPARYRPTTQPIRSVPDRIREVPDHPPDYPQSAVDEARHYVKDGYRCRVQRPRPWWHRR